jgi:outer membrane lipoprotein SlyB
MRAWVRVTTLALIPLSLVACATRPAPPPPVYSPAYSQPVYSQYGTVRNIEVVQVADGRTTGGGALLGGVLGAVIGRQFGDSGRGRTTGTAVGAVGGAIIGNEIEKQQRGSQVYRVTIQMDGGGVRGLDVPNPNGLQIGERVLVEGDHIRRL